LKNHSLSKPFLVVGIDGSQASSRALSDALEENNISLDLRTEPVAGEFAQSDAPVEML